MHPELALLEQRYLELVGAVQAGHMSLDDALATLSGVSAVDGDGAVWSIDPASGQFTRALPGQAPVPADPSVYQPSLLPPPPPRFEDPSAAWAPGPLPGQVSAPSPAAPLGASPLGVSPSPSAMDRARALMSGRGRFVLVGVVAAVLVGAMLMGRGGESTPDVQPSASPSPSASSVSPSPSGSPAPSPSGAPAVPTKTQQDQILKIVTSGDKESLRQFLTAAEDKGAALLSLAPLTGAVRLGFVLVPASVTPGESGVTFVVAVRDGQGDRALYSVPLVARGKGWVLAAPVSRQG